MDAKYPGGCHVGGVGTNTGAGRTRWTPNIQADVMLAGLVLTLGLGGRDGRQISRRMSCWRG